MSLRSTPALRALDSSLLSNRYPVHFGGMKTAADDPFRLNTFGKISQAFYRAMGRIPVVPFSGPYNLTISHERKFVWFRVAKVGTRTILDYFKKNSIPLDVARAGFLYYSPELYEDHFKFAFVRNPWDRLVSCWTDKVVNLNYFKFAESELATMRRFDSFVEYVSRLDLETCDRHLRLQCRLIDLNHLDFLGRMETFEQDFRKVCIRLKFPQQPIPSRNVSRKRPFQEYYNDSLRVRVEEIYARDIQTFGYSFGPSDGAARTQ